MKIRIHEETGDSSLNAAQLACEVALDGYVVFRSGRLRQRSLAKAVSTILEGEISVTTCETHCGNACMCVVDNARFDFFDVLERAADTDGLLT